MNSIQHNCPTATPGTVRSKFDMKLQILIAKLGVDFVEPAFLYRRTMEIMPPTTGGFFEPKADYVCVRLAIPLLGLYDRHNHWLMHELIHWSGHTSRLSRGAIAMVLETGSINALSSEQYDTEEAVAELGALKLAQRLGLPTEAVTKYAEEYLARHPKADLVRAARDAETAVNYLLDRTPGVL